MSSSPSTKDDSSITYDPAMLISEDVLFKQLELLEQGLELKPDANCFPVEVFQREVFIVEGFIEHSPIIKNGVRAVHLYFEQRALQVQQLVFNRSVFENAIDEVVHDHVDVEVGIDFQELLEFLKLISPVDD